VLVAVEIIDGIVTVAVGLLGLHGGLIEGVSVGNNAEVPLDADGSAVWLQRDKLDAAEGIPLVFVKLLAKLGEALDKVEVQIADAGY
jgi:hypothetical protein